jgi:hypothetical protein
MTKENLPLLAIWLVPAILSIVALANLPYGYYQFLRIVVCIAAGYLTYREYKLKNGLNAWVIIFSLLAILFNPFISIHLTRAVWAFFNVVCAAIFIAHLIIQIRKNNFLGKI